MASRPCRLKLLFGAMISTDSTLLNNHGTNEPLSVWSPCFSGIALWVAGLKGHWSFIQCRSMRAQVSGPQSKQAWMIRYWLLPLTLGRSDEKGAHSQKPSSLEHSLERRGKGLKMPRDHKKERKTSVRNLEGGLNGQQPLCQLGAGSYRKLLHKCNWDQLARPNTQHPNFLHKPPLLDFGFYLQKKRIKICLTFHWGSNLLGVEGSYQLLSWQNVSTWDTLFWNSEEFLYPVMRITQ